MFKTYRWLLMSTFTLFSLLALTLVSVGGSVYALPTNDHINSPIIINALPFNYTQNSDGAGLEFLSLTCDGETANWSVWYQYTPPTNQSVRFTTSQLRGHGFPVDTVLVVFTGINGAYSSIACGRTDFNRSDPVYAEPDLIAGITYYIGVGARLQGEFDFNAAQIFPPTNDDPDTAQVIPSLPFETDVNPTDAAQSTVRPACGSIYDPQFALRFGRVVWYRYTPTADDQLKFSVTGGTRKQVGIFTGTPAFLTEIACSYSLGAGVDLNGTIDVFANTTYFFGITGDAVLHVRLEGLTVPAGGVVRSFTLINADTDQALMTLNPTNTLNLQSLPTRHLAFRANTDPATVGSVIMQLTAPCESRTQVENRPPYSLFGDLPGASGADYGGFEPKTQDVCGEFYTLTAMPYSGENGTGTAGTPLTISFTVVDLQPTPAFTPSITGLTLIDATTDTVIGALNNGDTITLSALPSRFLTVVANTNPAAIGSVRFVLNGGAHTQTENQAPYSLTGELPNSSGGYDYNGWDFAPGSYTLEVTPYALANLGGSVGSPLIVNFTVVE